MTTEKLYGSSPGDVTFAAPSWELGAFDGAPSVILPHTLFYPESGGQLGDRGTLDIGGVAVPVLDTRIDDAGIIHHRVAAPPAAEPGPVVGTLDADRRRDQTTQHTAQHALSQALYRAARAETVSARLGESTSTIDVDVAALGDAPLHDAEDRVNAVVRDDAPIAVTFPTEAELRALPLRRAPKVASGVRVVSIGDFDVTPCGGTHLASAGRMGYVHVVGVERYKGGTRVTFVAGARAVAHGRATTATLGALARSLTCGPEDIASQLDKLRAELDLARAARGSLQGELARTLAALHLSKTPEQSGAPTVVAVARERADVGLLRALAGALTERPDVVAVCVARDGDGCPIVVQRGARAAVDCGRLLKEITQKLGGRGGGRPERAEGRVGDVAPELVVELAKSLPFT
ncbi:MAG: alanyl-tRNA editing protein [Myxococcales bacterium]|nr:alanyl-tRNA editing protein [Myxococcales bacterium]